MKTKLYRTVSVEERLPEESEIVMYRTKYGSSKVGFLSHNGIFISENYTDKMSEVDWWLEEVELPSDEGIENESYNGWVSSHFKAGAFFILNHIKGR